MGRADRPAFRQAAHLRGNCWAGSGLGRKELHLWGEPMKKPSGKAAWKKRLWNFALNHRYVNSYQMPPELMAEYLETLNEFRPDVIVGYSHSLYLFARFALESGRKVWSPRGLIGTAERLLPHYRETIEAAFRAPIYDRYGCREVMLIGMECEQHRGLHLTAENLYVEILKDGRPAAPGETGEVVVTDLHNYAMPFLRYRNGDLAVASDRRCACERGLPLVEEMTGRTLDVLRTPSGRRMSGVFVPMFFINYAWVEEFQIEQTALDRMHVRLKPVGAADGSRLELLRQDLERRIGSDVRLECELVNEIPRNASGKHRPVISRLGGPESAEEAPCRLSA
jgi:phenylacetate-CoA ligase